MDFVETPDPVPLRRNSTFSLMKSDYFDDIKTVRKFMRELLSALDFMHSKGVIHRDVKASNIVVDKEGKLTVIDFDLAEFQTPEVKLNYLLAIKGKKIKAHE